MYVTIPSGETPTPMADAVAQTTRKILPTRLRAGAYLYYEGDEVARLYRVLTGVVRLTRLLDDGRRQVISFGYPGDIIGFPAAGKHHTDCNALVDTTLQPYNRAAMETGTGDPDLQLFLIEAALEEISAMQDHFLMLGRKSAAEKVASFLVVLAERCGEETDGVTRIGLPMCRSDIADFLGLTTETVSRTFTSLKKTGVIRLTKAHVIDIVDAEGLAEIASGRH